MRLFQLEQKQLLVVKQLLIVIPMLSVLSTALITADYTPDNCDVTSATKKSTSWIPYTGLKLLREVVFRDDSVRRYMSSSQCDKGELEAQTISGTGDEADVAWGMPMCFFSERRIVVDDPKKHMKPRYRNISLSDLPKLPHSRNPLAKPPQVLSLEPRSLSDKLQDLLEQLSRDGQLVEHTQGSLVSKLQDLKVISYNNLTQDDVNQLKCFKMARRKKYSLRNKTLYSPNTWVGGLFECHVSESEKLRYLASLKSAGSKTTPAIPFQISCNSSKPLLPLIADDATSISASLDDDRLLKLRIPYLLTPAVSPLETLKLGGKLPQLNKFQPSDVNNDSSLYHDEKWYEGISASEDYHYSPEDGEKVLKALRHSKSLVEDLLKHREDAIIRLLFQQDDIELKLIYLLSKLDNAETSLQFLESLQQPWDELTLSEERFHYSNF